MTTLRLVPWPKQIELLEGSVTILKRIAVDADDRSVDVARTFADDLLRQGFDAVMQSATDVQDALPVRLRTVGDASMGAEDYRLTVSTDGVELTAAQERGLFWGTRTLLQLLQGGAGGTIPCLSIEDAPVLGYRGLMIDAARKWHTVDFHLQTIRRMASIKMNAYHIHFSDWQSYTLPSERFPALPTEGLHYTRDEIAQMVDTARQYHVTLVPEIDVPGHAGAMLSGMPELCCQSGEKLVCMGSDQVLETLCEVMAEVMEMIPGPYWHLGADEVPYKWVEACPVCQARIKEDDLDGVHSLYNQFINRVHRFVKAQGRRMFVWEGFRKGVLPAIDMDVTVFPFDIFREGRKPVDYLEAGYKVINSSWAPLYIAGTLMTTPEDIAQWDHFQFGSGWAPTAIPWWNKFEPPQPQIIGAQMCSWGNEEKAENGLLFGDGRGYQDYGRPGARAPIAAERMWTGLATTKADLLERTGEAYWQVES